MRIRKTPLFTLLICGLVAVSPSYGRQANRLISPSASIPNTQSDRFFFRISGPEGEQIGHQEESYRKTAEGERTEIRISEFSLIIDGHDPVSASNRRTIAYAPDNEEIRFEALIATQVMQVEFSAIITGNHARITRKIGEQTQIYDQILPANIPIADAEALRNDLDGDFLSFSPASGKFEQLTAKTVSQPENSQFSGQLRIIYRDNFPIDLRIIEKDPSGNLISATQPQPGSPFRFEPVDSLPSQIGPRRRGRTGHPMVASPHSISNHAKNGHIRYRVTLAPSLAQHLPETPEQSVIHSPEGPRIDICSSCGVSLPEDPASLEKWTQPTRWLQSEFEPIARRGASMAARNISDRRKLDLLARIVRRRLGAVDFNGHSSARSAWERRSGDCTEDATLLAALARASGIPTRVVSGIAYSRERYHGATSAFIPHAWVIAYADGEWISYDMTLTEGFGASHIALTIGEGEASQMVASNMIAGMLEWRSLSQVRQRPEAE